MNTTIVPFGSHSHGCGYDFVSIIPLQDGTPVCPAENFPIIGALSYGSSIRSAINLIKEAFGNVSFKLKPLCDYCVAEGEETYVGACYTAEFVSVGEPDDTSDLTAAPFDLPTLNRALFSEFCLAS